MSASLDSASPTPTSTTLSSTKATCFGHGSHRSLYPCTHSFLFTSTSPDSSSRVQRCFRRQRRLVVNKSTATTIIPCGPCMKASTHPRSQHARLVVRRRRLRGSSLNMIDRSQIESDPVSLPPTCIQLTRPTAPRPVACLRTRVHSTDVHRIYLITSFVP